MTLPGLITRPRGLWVRYCPHIKFMGGTGRSLLGATLTAAERRAA